MNNNQKIISLAIITLLVTAVATIILWISVNSELLALFGSATFFCGMVAGYGCYLAIQLRGKHEGQKRN